MAKTPTARKKPATGKTAKPKKVADPKSAPVDASEAVAAPKKPRVRKTAAEAATPGIHVSMHGETRIHHQGGDASAAAVATIGEIVDAVHAAGRVRITSAAHSGGTTTLHAVLPDHPTPYDRHPGLILSIDGGRIAFDHVDAGPATPALVENAAHAILVAMAGNDPDAMSRRRVDWFEQAVIAAESLADRQAAL